jgi:dTDP-4-amino-4,6-dideoxygalactose transaminase
VKRPEVKPVLHDFGSDFFRRPTQALLPDESPSFRYTFHGRYAMFQALVAMRSEGKTVVLVPGYDCPVVIETIIDAGFEPRFYALGVDLSADADDMHEKWDDTVAAIILTSYFGFPCDMSAVTPEMLRSAYVIEDCAHSFLSCNPLRLAGGRADVSIYAFWKIVPSTVGAALSLENDRLAPASEERTIPFMQTLRIAKGMLQQLLPSLRFKTPMPAALRIDSGVDDEAPEPVEVTMAIHRLDPQLTAATIPWLSRRVLEAADLDAICQARRRNYRIYHEGIRESSRVHKVFRDFPDQVCPWIFPLILEGRTSERLDYRLRDQGVLLHTFANVLHPVVASFSDTSVWSNALYLSNNLVCLAIHQDIAAAAIETSCETINAFMATLQ